MAEDRTQQLGERWLRLQQAEQVDRARQPPQHAIEPDQRLIRVARARQAAQHLRQRRLQRGAGSRAAERGIAAAAPIGDAPRRLVGGVEAKLVQPRLQQLRVRRHRRPVGRAQRVVHRRHALHLRAQQIEQGGAVRQPVQPCDIVERLRRGRQAVRLAIVDHLQPVLDRAEQRVALRQRGGLFGVDPARPGEHGECVQGRRRAQAAVAAAMDQLVHLGEELRLADAAAPALQVIAGAERLALGIMVANAPGDLPDLRHRAIVQRAPPHERADRDQEPPPQRQVARRRPRADEGGALPRQRLRFIIADRRAHRQRDRRCLGRGPQPQVHAQHIAVAVARLEQLGRAPGDLDRRLVRRLPLAVRQRRAIEQQDRVHIGRIVELAAALLAERDRHEPLRRRARGPLLDRGADRHVERTVREGAEQPRHPTQVIGAGKVAQRHQQRDAPPLDPQPPRDPHVGIVDACVRKRIVRPCAVEQRRLQLEQPGKKRGVLPRAQNCRVQVHALWCDGSGRGRNDKSAMRKQQISRC